MKKNYLLSILVLAIIFSKADASFAQAAITLDASSVASTFRFIQSNGVQDKGYSRIFTSGFSVGYRYLAKSGFILSPRLGMRKGGATYVFDASNYSWNLQYADLKVSAGYMLKKDRFSPYLMVAPYYAVLLAGTQVLNNQNYDIKNSHAIQNSDYGLFITPGVQMKVSDSFSAFAEFNYMAGLRNLETSSNGEKSYNRAMSLTFGVAFSLKATEQKTK